jgi:hypothetical protein
MIRFVSFTTGCRRDVVLGDGFRPHLLDQLHRVLGHVVREPAQKGFDGLLGRRSARRAPPGSRRGEATSKSGVRPVLKPRARSASTFVGSQVATTICRSSSAIGKIRCLRAIVSGIRSAAFGSAFDRSATSRRKYSATSSGEIVVGDPVRARDFGPGLGSGAPRGMSGRSALPCPARSAIRTSQCTAPPPLRAISGLPLSADARFPCFSRYMAASASATRSSSRTRGSSSWWPSRCSPRAGRARGSTR